VECLRTEIETRYATIVGQSPAMKSVIEMAKRTANSDAGVLLLGESGTGKELFARSMHQWSPRRAMPFVVINCVALTETLLENELFGHEKGAFTGADRLQKGKIELADSGTIFLDEIGDMPASLQAKLLRVLQDHEFQRVGGTRTVKVNIRVIAATNKDLKRAVKDGRFREDLFFRLNVVTLTLPPLRDRTDDLPRLADFFLSRHAREIKKGPMRLAPDTLAAIQRYTWPGNVRELDNAIARAVVLSEHDLITPDLLALSPWDSPAGSGDGSLASYLDLPYHDSMEEHSIAVIRHALDRAHGNQTKAAERLKLQRTYLARLIKQKGIGTSDTSLS
jgi:transcriptional regulator with PAS, ATPase and Fis domain